MLAEADGRGAGSCCAAADASGFDNSHSQVEEAHQEALKTLEMRHRLAFLQLQRDAQAREQQKMELLAKQKEKYRKLSLLYLVAFLTTRRITTLWPRLWKGRVLPWQELPWTRAIPKWAKSVAR